jgi:DNA-binding CsgD family transcriptional regulator/tetratricopeptide (TPR) repeat protein
MRISKCLFVIFFLITCSLIAPAQNTSLANNQKYAEDSIVLLIKKSSVDSVKLKHLLGLINLYQDTQPEKTFQWIEQAKSISTKSKLYDQLLMFSILDMRSKTRLGKFSEALAIANQSNYLLKEKVFPKTSSGFHLQKGQVFYKMGEYEKAAQEFNFAATIGKQNNLPEVEIKAFFSITLLMDFLEKYTEMRELLLKAQSVAEKNKLYEDVANIKINLALLESRTNNYGKAIEYLNEALIFFEQKNNYVLSALCYANLGYGYLQTKDYKKALQNAQQSFLLRNKLNDKAGIAKLHITVGQIYLETAQYDSSLYHLNKGIDFSTSLKLSQNLKDGYKLLSKVYERKKQYESAYYNLQIHSDWKDTTFQQEKQKQLLQQLNVYKAKFADSLVVQKDLIIHQQLSTINWLWVAASILFVLLLAIIFWFIKQRNVLKNKYELVTLKENESNDKTENSRLKEEISKMQVEMQLLQNSHKGQTREDLINLRKLVSESNLQTDGYWNEFLLLFSSVYPNFFEQLKVQYTELSQNELRICTLIKLNLSLLEIATLLNITAESARKARYRIYKKMNLNSDKELVEKLLVL